MGLFENWNLKTFTKWDMWPKSGYTVHAQVEEMGNDDHLGVDLRLLHVFTVPIAHVQLNHVSFLYGP